MTTINLLFLGAFSNEQGLQEYIWNYKPL